MKIFIWLAVPMIAVTSVVMAQDSTTSQKIDTVLMYQKKMSQQQEQIYDEVVRYREPLENKKYGIEFNPAYFLYSTSQHEVVLSGGFSLFDVDRGAEIAFPIFFQSGTNSEVDGRRPGLTLWNQDIVYRRFLGQHQDGFYLSGGIRFTHIRGELENGISLFGLTLYSPGASSEITTDKLGMMFGIGYRYFSYSSVYWGTSICVGRYFSADERDIRGVSIDDTKLILDIELLKFGIAF